MHGGVGGGGREANPYPDSRHSMIDSLAAEFQPDGGEGAKRKRASRAPCGELQREQVVADGNLLDHLDCDCPTTISPG